jgi:SHS2 domain-containing protein
MPYRFLEHVAIADVAFEAEERTLPELLRSSALALTDTMIANRERMEWDTTRFFDIEAPDPEMLLYRFLQELVFYKDAERLLFRDFEPEIVQEVPWMVLRVKAYGEVIDPDKHELLADVKAVSLHKFTVRKIGSGWRVEAVLDV